MPASELSPATKALFARLVPLDKLSPEARELGLREVLEDEWYAYHEKLAEYRAQRAEKGLHWAINHPGAVRRTVNHLALIRKYQRDPAYFLKVVESNLTLFEPDGMYYRFRFPGGRPT